MYTLGIDLHKRASTWSLINESHTEIWKTSVVSHPDHFSKTLPTVPVAPQDLQVAIEPVAGWRWATQLLEEHGCDVHMAHPRKVKLIAESKQKTDALDAYQLARLLASGYFPEARRVPDTTYDLRLLLRTRSHIVRLRTSVLNRIHGIATTTGLHTIPGGNPCSVVGKQTLLASESILRELHLLADALTERIKALDHTCEQSVAQFPDTVYLRSMPGVGIITALTVVAEVGDFCDFASAKKLASYAGLVPKQRSSGTRVRYGGITHEGSPYLRTILVEAAMRIHPKGAPELYQVVSNLTPRCGAKKARVALARKLLSIMWTLVATQTTYNPSLVSSATTILSNPDTGAGA